SGAYEVGLGLVLHGDGDGGEQRAACGRVNRVLHNRLAGDVVVIRVGGAWCEFDDFVPRSVAVLSRSAVQPDTPVHRAVGLDDLVVVVADVAPDLVQDEAQGIPTSCFQHGVVVEGDQGDLLVAS